MDGYFLVFLFEVLPPKPWPVIIAGVQPYFTVDPNDNGPLAAPIKRSSRSLCRIYNELNARGLGGNQIDEAFDMLKKFFLDADISITELQYWGNFFIIVLENESTDLTIVPCAFGQVRCFYLYETEMGRPTRDNYTTRREQDPTVNVVDNTLYDHLRPGIMLSSGWDSKVNCEVLTSGFS